ncbi:MAG TPA: reverse transcriptase/maturase family protein [archaeon]|nr:reverse transcriptase/maturase family protein [archaeon]
MKTFRNLWPRIIAFENVYNAYLKARRGKRYKHYSLAFTANAEEELWSIITDLKDKTYRPGPYYTFWINEPKKRLIAAAPFRDRVVHHAVCNVIEPLYDRTFIHDSYACRVGKGTHRALFRAWEFMRGNQYVLKCDIRKYFPSIDHGVLKGLLRGKIACRDTLHLLEKIIEHGDTINAVPGVGLPIGNLTSQFFANLYLNELDYYCKVDLQARCYLRYMDDFMLFSNSREYLHDCRARIREFLAGMRLEFKPGKNNIFPVRNGFEFLGFFNRPELVRVRKEGVRRHVKRLHRYRLLYNRGLLPLAKITESLVSWSAHASYANSYRLRQSLAWGFVL